MPVKLNSSAGGSVTLDVPATGTNTTLNLPTAGGTILASDGSGNVTFSGATTFSGNATFNAGLVPSSSFLRNRIINGDMRISQRNGTSAGTYGAGTAYWLDRWVNTATIANNMQAQQSTVAPAGFNNSTIFRALTGATIGSSDLFVSAQIIEGFNVGDLAWGTASAATITVSFWVRSSVTGTFGGSIRNNSVNRSYPFTYSIASADTWTYRTITIPGDTTGTWATDNSGGLSLTFDLGSGSTFRGTAGAWAAANFVGATGSVSPMATSGATFYVTGVQLEVGAVATPFERRQYGQELALCQRYFCNSSGNSEYHVVPAPGATYLGTYRINMPVLMRANPTVSVNYSASNAILDFGWYTQNAAFMVHYITASLSTNAFMWFTWSATSEL
jgi:hypothetical protein